MTTDTSLARTYTDLQGLNAIRTLARGNSTQAVNAAAREFEAMFIQMMLKGMREAALTENPFESEQMRLYQDLFDKQVAMDMAGRGELGVTDLIVKQLGKDKLAPGEGLSAEPGGDRLDSGASQSTPVDSKGRPHFQQEYQGPIQSPEEFIAAMRPHAEEAAHELGVSPEVLLAQSALETGWGKKVIRHPDGTSSHNMFGIKADPGWDGERVSVGSLEYENGAARRKVSAFRAYDSYAESFKDHAQFLRNNPRYAQALRHARDPETFVESLQAAGYATDPHYAEKIKDILQREPLREAHLASAGGMIERG